MLGDLANAAGAGLNAINAATSAPPGSDQQIKGLIEGLELKLQRTNLILQTLLHLMHEKGVVQEDEFREWMKYVDEFDGQADGKLAFPPGFMECPNCQRRSSDKLRRCMYCGHEFPTEYLARDRRKDA